LESLVCLGNLLFDVAPNGADRFAGYRSYKYFAPTEPLVASAESRGTCCFPSFNPAAAGLGYLKSQLPPSLKL
jgi:hypothetical protein